jgi:hypothetical protein
MIFPTISGHTAASTHTQSKYMLVHTVTPTVVKKFTMSNVQSVARAHKCAYAGVFFCKTITIDAMSFRKDCYIIKLKQ